MFACRSLRKRRFRAKLENVPGIYTHIFTIDFNKTVRVCGAQRGAMRSKEDPGFFAEKLDQVDTVSLQARGHNGTEMSRMYENINLVPFHEIKRPKATDKQVRAQTRWGISPLADSVEMTWGGAARSR